MRPDLTLVPARRQGKAPAWTVKARRNAIAKLGRQLSQDGIQTVTLESTSDYWRIWFYVLEAAGLAVQAGDKRCRGRGTCRAHRKRTSSMRCGWPG